MPGEPLSPDEISQPCPHEGCQAVITGKASSGPGSVAFKMGAHRARDHNYRSGSYKRGGGRRPPQPVTPSSEEANEGVTPLGVASSVLDDLRADTKRAPTVDELRNALARGSYTISYAAASSMVETDPNLRGAPDNVKEYWTKYLSLSQQASREIASPVARTVGTSKLNKKVGRAVVNNVELANSVAAVVMLGVRWKVYLELRKAAIPAAPPATPSPQAPPAPRAAPASSSATVPKGAPEPGSGVLIGFEDIARFRGNGGPN